MNSLLMVKKGYRKLCLHTKLLEQISHDAQVIQPGCKPILYLNKTFARQSFYQAIKFVYVAEGKENIWPVTVMQSIRLVPNVAK